jgi:hypothetical protein
MKRLVSMTEGLFTPAQTRPLYALEQDVQTVHGISWGLMIRGTSTRFSPIHGGCELDARAFEQLMSRCNCMLTVATVH